jgi:hypothetical protein
MQACCVVAVADCLMAVRLLPGCCIHLDALAALAACDVSCKAGQCHKGPAKAHLPLLLLPLLLLLLLLLLPPPSPPNSDPLFVPTSSSWAVPRPCIKIPAIQ